MRARDFPKLDTIIKDCSNENDYEDGYEAFDSILKTMLFEDSNDDGSAFERRVYALDMAKAARVANHLVMLTAGVFEKSEKSLVRCRCRGRR